uniref:FAS1 domain-containing protein n=1 Tax=Aegilops tauschii TaxID=37682 RepID=M8BYC9_AEGTA
MASLAGAALASCSILLLLLVPCAQGQGQSPEAPEEAWAEGQPPEASEDALTMLLSEGGCGAFAGLVAATAGVGDAAVGTFIPRFHSLNVDEQVAVLLYHGLTMAYSEELLSWVHWEELTLDGVQMLTMRHHSGRVIVSSSRSEARITKTVVDDDHLAVYLIDAVLIPADPKRQISFWGVLALIVFLLVLVVVGVVAS